MLLTTNEFRDRLALHLSQAADVEIFSAFLSLEAMEWVLSARADKLISKVLVRGLPRDVIAGACSFDALRLLIESEIPVKLSSAFHGKIYLLDEVGFVGSANLTSKGLALNARPNEELGTEIPLSRDDRLVLDNIWRQGITLNQNNLQAYEDFIDELGATTDFRGAALQSLPSSIFNEERDLYCADFPTNSDDIDGEWGVYSSLSAKPAYLWLCDMVKAAGDSGCSFGFLSSELHTAVFDDPAPYRRTIKELLNNLLHFVEQCDSELLLVSRPRHSQVVTLR